MSKLELIATATFGLEAVVAREIKELGYDQVNWQYAGPTFGCGWQTGF